MRRIAAMAESYVVALAPHCPLGPIALAANIQIAAANPNHVIQEMSLGIHYNVGNHPEVWKVEGGYINLMKGSGLGIEINEEQIRSHSEGAKPWMSPGFIGPGFVGSGKAQPFGMCQAKEGLLPLLKAMLRAL